MERGRVDDESTGEFMDDVNKQDIHYTNKRKRGKKCTHLYLYVCLYLCRTLILVRLRTILSQWRLPPSSSLLLSCGNHSEISFSCLARFMFFTPVNVWTVVFVFGHPPDNGFPVSLLPLANAALSCLAPIPSCEAAIILPLINKIVLHLYTFLVLTIVLVWIYCFPFLNR